MVYYMYNLLRHNRHLLHDCLKMDVIIFTSATKLLWFLNVRCPIGGQDRLRLVSIHLH